MIRAIRPNAMAQDDASLVTGWNVAPNVAYTLRLLPGTSSCGAYLYDEDGSTLIASGAALAGTDQPCVLIPQTGQAVEMVDADLGWHLLLATTGTESQRTIRIGPAVDLPDEIHPVYGDDDLAMVRATAAIDEAAHYLDDVTVSCPIGLVAGLGDVVSVPVDGVAVVGQVESVTWTATPDGTQEQAVIRRHVAIAPDEFVEPTPITPPTVVDDSGETDAETGTSGNVLTNDEAGLTVVAVNGLSANVGVAVDGNNGGLFTINSDGAWTFDPDGDFALLTGSETADTSVAYHASDGTAEAMATLTITVSASASGEPWTFAEVTTFGWWDASDSATVGLSASEVTVWADKSGNDRDFVDGGNIAGPAYADNALVFAGAQGLHIDSTTMFNFLHTTGGTVIVVGEFGGSENPGVDMAIVGNDWGISSLNGYWLALGDASPANNCVLSYAHRTNNWIAGTWNGSSHNTNYNNLVSPQTLTQITAITDIGNSTVANRYRVSVDGSDEVAANACTGSPAAVSASMTFGLGAIKYVNNVWYIHLTGKIRELVIFDSVPSADVLAKAQGYLAHKWDTLLGVTTMVTALPSDHPYKSAPPTI